MDSLYSQADAEIRACIADYLELLEQSSNLNTLKTEHLNTQRKVVIVLAGIGLFDLTKDASEAVNEWGRRRAIPFDIETAITASVYQGLRKSGAEMLDFVEKNTNGFQRFDAPFIAENPSCLPLLQHLAGIFSKAALKKAVGSVSDNSISKPASERLSKLLGDRVNAEDVNKGEVLKRLESTLEGIVRDLVGRVLLEF